MSSWSFFRFFSARSPLVSARAALERSCWSARFFTSSRTAFSTLDGLDTACSPRTAMKFFSLSLGCCGAMIPSAILSRFSCSRSARAWRRIFFRSFVKRYL